MKKSIIFFCVALLLGVAGIAGAAPFQNGSFESLGAGTGSSTFFFPLDPDTVFPVTGWTLAAGAVSYVGTGWQAAAGTSSIGLSFFLTFGTAGSLSQTFDTVAGTLYKVIFAMAGNPDGNSIGADPIKDLRVSAAGLSEDFTFDTSGKTRPNMGWADKSFTFTPLENTATLTFMSLENDAFGPAIDNVRVSAVPEPASLLLLTAGLGGLAFFGRKKFVN